MKKKTNWVLVVIVIVSIALSFAYISTFEKVSDRANNTRYAEFDDSDTPLEVDGNVTKLTEESFGESEQVPSSLSPTTANLPRPDFSDTQGEVLPSDGLSELNADKEELPEDLRRQLESPPPPLPEDLQAQLDAPTPPLPDDIKRALATPPRTVTLEEVNNPDRGNKQETQ